VEYAMIENSPRRSRAGFFAILGLLLAHAAGAQTAEDTAAPPTDATVPQVGQETNLPLPRYVSLKARRANARRGPSTVYPIDWVFTQPGIPLEIIAEFENWRKVRTVDDAEGWIVSSFLSGRRTGLITTDDTHMHILPDDSTLAVAKANRMVIAKIRTCKDDWCLIEIEDQKGWVHKTNLWGVYPKETF